MYGFSMYEICSVELANNVDKQSKVNGIVHINVSHNYLCYFAIATGCLDAKQLM